MSELDSVIEKPTIKNILPCLDSALALDISKNHTGIVIWNGKEVEIYGFELNELNKTDYHTEYRMRLDFKEKLKAIISGRQFEWCIVEDVYGGENFDTVRKLLALQTVIDELIFEGCVKVTNFRRYLQSQWSALARRIYKQQGALKSKYETQGLLEYLEWDYYLEHKDMTNAQKTAIFFEDKCDAMGMIVAAVAEKSFKPQTEQRPQVIRISDIKLVYLEDYRVLKSIRDKRIKTEPFTHIDLPHSGNLEKNIINAVMSNTDDVLCAELPVSRLGQFGLKHKFNFYPSGVGYLIFYYKTKKGDDNNVTGTSAR